MNVVLAARKLSKLFTVIKTLVVVAVNLYQTPFVVVDVAPPHVPVGAAFTAPCRLPVVGVQVADGVRLGAEAQVLCANKTDGKLSSKKTATELRTSNMVFIRGGFCGSEKRTIYKVLK
jgi:hypothetical protein